MGDILPDLLSTMKIPYRVLEEQTLEDAIGWATSTLKQTSRPTALVLPPGVTA